jgi:hypothetical protein
MAVTLELGINNLIETQFFLIEREKSITKKDLIKAFVRYIFINKQFLLALQANTKKYDNIFVLKLCNQK